MAIRYHFSISCKRIGEAGWVIIMQADRGEIPMSIVQPSVDLEPHSEATETAATLTTEPIAQKISDTGFVIRYLRQLNRRPGREFTGHNDAVIWNLSLRLPKLVIGQEARVRVSFFANKGLSSGIYEIQALGVFPEDVPTKRSVRQSDSNPQFRAALPNAVVAEEAGNQLSSNHTFQIPQEISDIISQLATRVESHQDELLMVQETLQIVSERVERLETENRQLEEIHHPQETTIQHPPQNTPDSIITQPPEISEKPELPEETEIQAADIDDDTDEPDLFECLAESRTKSATVKNVSTRYDLKSPHKKQ